VTSAIILAGGLGTRLRGAVPNLPKPMAPIAGRPFLEYQLDYWISQGVGRFVLSVGYRHEAIVAYFGSAYRGIPIEYAIEAKPLGTGGGLLLAFARIGHVEPFLLLNGDTYFEVDLAELRELHEKKQSDWTFSLFRTSEAGRYMGMEIDQAGRITALRSVRSDPEGLANGGVYFVNPDAVRSIQWMPGDKLSLEEDLLPAALASGERLFGFESHGLFIDIGVPEDYLRAAGVLAA
jgi:D-glycero-alpha-D-manno-heptose 1-phosphate guanylyltransferase